MNKSARTNAPEPKKPPLELTNGGFRKAGKINLEREIPISQFANSTAATV